MKKIFKRIKAYFKILKALTRFGVYEDIVNNVDYVIQTKVSVYNFGSGDNKLVIEFELLDEHIFDARYKAPFEGMY